MSQINLVIFDEDEAYVNGFVEYILQFQYDNFEIKSFTQNNFFQEYYENNNKKIDVLLIEENLYAKSILNENNLIFILNENLNEKTYINKYKKIDELLSDILNRYNELKVEKIVSKNKPTKIIAVYSPIGGIGKTTISLYISKQLAMDNQSVIYINLETINSNGLYFDEKLQRSMGELIYLLKHSKNINVEQKLKEYINKDNKTKISYISSTENLKDIEYLKSEDIELLLKKLKQVNEYKYIILDLSSEIDSRKIDILNMSDQVIVATNNKEEGLYKINYLNNQLEKDEDSKSLKEKFIYVINNYTNENNEINNEKDKNLMPSFKLRRIQNEQKLRSLECLDKESLFQEDIKVITEYIK